MSSTGRLNPAASPINNKRLKIQSPLSLCLSLALSPFVSCGILLPSPHPCLSLSLSRFLCLPSACLSVFLSLWLCVWVCLSLSLSLLSLAFISSSASLSLCLLLSLSLSFSFSPSVSLFLLRAEDECWDLPSVQKLLNKASDVP